MTEPKPVDRAHARTCYYLLGAGAVLFALGAYAGFVLHANAALVFIVLGASIALFASAFLIGLKQHAIKSADPSKAAPQPEAEVASQADAKPPNQHDADVVILMKTTLGELLLAAVRKDAKGAQRLFAQAGLQMEGQTTAAPAESAEPKLEANSKPTADLTPRIAQRAYELFEEGGHKDGAAVQNWKEAESEIRQGLGKAKSLPKTNLEPMPVGKLESKPETKDPPQIVANVASQPEAKATLKPGIKSEQ